MKGRSFTPEHKRKLKEAKVGTKLSESHRVNMSRALKGRVQTEEHKVKNSESKKGDKNPSWKGGVSIENRRIRETREYKLWRTAVFQRDNYACIWGGKAHGKRLNADHIKPFALFPELRFAIDNGRTLCEDCHRKTPTYGVKKQYA